MTIVEFTEFLIKGLVKEPDMVSVKEIGEEDGLIIIQVLVNESDMGAVIGRNGNIIKSVRTLVQVAAYQENKKVRIDIDSF